jgi:hypothetical protein
MGGRALFKKGQKCLVPHTDQYYLAHVSHRATLGGTCARELALSVAQVIGCLGFAGPPSEEARGRHILLLAALRCEHWGRQGHRGRQTYPLRGEQICAGSQLL